MNRSHTERVRQRQEVIRPPRRHPRRRGGRSAAPARARRAGDERGAQPAGGRRGEVAVVRGDHHHLAGLEPERGDARPVDARVGLVGAGDLGAEDRVPRQPGVAREVDRLRDVAVGARRDR